jgi:hypothetical protein
LSRLAAHGLGAEVPDGWDGEIYQRADDGLTPLAAGARGPHHPPILHLATFPLPADRGDFGGGALDAMGVFDLFVSLIEHEPAAARTPLFGRDGVPWPLRADDFRPDAMRVPRPGHSGRQEFFHVGDRAFALYVVIGSHLLRRLLVSRANAGLAGVRLD